MAGVGRLQIEEYPVRKNTGKPNPVKTGTGTLGWKRLFYP